MLIEQCRSESTKALFCVSWRGFRFLNGQQYNKSGMTSSANILLEKPAKILEITYNRFVSHFWQYSLALRKHTYAQAVWLWFESSMHIKPSDIWLKVLPHLFPRHIS